MIAHKIIVFFLVLSGVPSVRGAAVRLAFSGVIDELLEGDRFPETTPFQVLIDYEVPVQGDSQFPNEVTFPSIEVDARLVISGATFTMPFMNVAGDLTMVPGGEEWLLGIGVADLLGSGGVEPFQYSSLVLGFRIPAIAIDDPGQLPDSLDQWDLNAGSVNLRFTHEDESDPLDFKRWSFRSTTLSEISLGSIPEPSSVILVVSGSTFFFRRRRGVRR